MKYNININNRTISKTYIIISHIIKYLDRAKMQQKN